MLVGLVAFQIHRSLDTSGVFVNYPVPQMDAIATYQAVWFEGRYRFALLSDVVRVSGVTFLQGEVEATIPLAGLQPRVDRLRIRSASFWVGIALASLSFVGWAVLVEGVGVDPWGFPSVLVGGLVWANSMLSLATVRKVEFAQFRTDAGVPALAIARTRRGGGDFDGFVEMVIEQVRKCKGLA